MNERCELLERYTFSIMNMFVQSDDELDKWRNEKRNN